MTNPLWHFFYFKSPTDMMPKSIKKSSCFIGKIRRNRKINIPWTSWKLRFGISDAESSSPSHVPPGQVEIQKLHENETGIDWVIQRQWHWHTEILWSELIWAIYIEFCVLVYGCIVVFVVSRQFFDLRTLGNRKVGTFTSRFWEWRLGPVIFWDGFWNIIPLQAGP